MKSCSCLCPFPHCPSGAPPLLVPCWGPCEISLVSLLMMSRERRFPEQRLAVSVSAGPAESSCACRSWCWAGKESAGAQTAMWPGWPQPVALGLAQAGHKVCWEQPLTPRAGKAEAGSAFPDPGACLILLQPAKPWQGAAQSRPGKPLEFLLPQTIRGLELSLCAIFQICSSVSWAAESTNERLKRD